MRTRRFALVAAVAIVVAACTVPTENFPAQNPDFEEQLEEINREADRRMAEMMRKNEKLLEQFEEEPLRITGFGDG